MDDLKEPLLPLDSPSDETSKMTALDFLKSSETKFDTYYIGEIYKEQTFNPFTALKSIAKIAAGFQQFISYKFQHIVGSTRYTFIITFRKMHTKNEYHIRLSILPENDLRCERKHASIMLTSDGDLEFPNERDKERNFTSIYKGQWTGDAIVRNMREMTKPQIDSYDFDSVVANVKAKIDDLGQILVNECKKYTVYLDSRSGQAGGHTRKHKRLTRRHKCVVKRKRNCKKSYRKRKYCKSKKSMRLRISVKSRK